MSGNENDRKDTGSDDDLPKAKGSGRGGAPQINDSAEARRERELDDGESHPDPNGDGGWEINENTVD